MRRDQTFHETLIPLLVTGIGARSYLELGCGKNETISRVNCELRYGVDIAPVETISEVRYFKMTTQEFIEKYAIGNAPYDCVFIDADHRIDAVWSDFRGIWPYVSPEGLIAVHDTNPETKADTIPELCGDSWKFARGLSGYEAVTLNYHPGLSLVRKRVQWEPSA